MSYRGGGRGGSYGDGRGSYPPSSGGSDYRGHHYSHPQQQQHTGQYPPRLQYHHTGYERGRDDRYQYETAPYSEYDMGNQYQRNQNSSYRTPYYEQQSRRNHIYPADDGGYKQYSNSSSHVPTAMPLNQTRSNSSYSSSPYPDSKMTPSKSTSSIQENNKSSTPKHEEPKLIMGKPIPKSYKLSDDKIQGNFISRIFNTLEDSTISTNHEQSFKTIHEKNPTNSKAKTRVEYVTGLSKEVPDPRLDHHSGYEKALSKSFFQFTDNVSPPTFKYDKYSLGDKPSNQILIWNLHSTTSALIIKNNFLVYGPISDVKIVDDPVTGVPMGMCLLSFDGKVEEAHQLAVDVVRKSNKTLLIQGRYIRCGLNTNNKLYDEIYAKTISVRKEKLKKQKKQEKEKEERLELERIKAEKLKNEQLRLERIRVEKLKAEKRQQAEDSSYSNVNHLNESGVSRTNESIKFNAAVHEKHILPSSRCKLSYKLQKYIDNRPFIYISDKYVSSLYVSADQIGRFLKKYKMDRILQQRYGFYLIFNNIDDAIDCFDGADGKKFFHYTMYMTLYIPDNEIENTRVGKLGNFQSAQKQIMRELNAYLFKDIREKIIGDMVLDVLKSDEMAKFAEEAKKKKDIEIEERKKLKIEENTIKELNPVTVVKRLNLNIFRKTKAKKPFVPISHTLNKENLDGSEEDEEEDDEEESEEDEDEDEDEDEEDDDHAVENEGVPLRKRKSISTSTANKKQRVSNKNGSVKTLAKEESSEDESSAEMEDSNVTSPEVENGSKALVSKPQIPDAYAPSTKFPGPVFDDSLETFKPTLDFLKNLVKTDEDFEIMKELVQGITIEKPIKDINFWAWEKMEAMRDYSKLTETKDEEGDDVEVFDYEDEILRNKDLRNETGCFKTEGYKKMQDRYKREYLLHRRKLTNLNPVKHDEDDESNATSHNNIQSSRVNRANTRRFVADISAQKQIIGETDLLDLNQLNKRKKPVQFARSAIHNWGLYALEPIGAGEMIIEYVGERIRQQVAELREKKYLRSGIGSSYLFRVDENTVIDASKKGGIARFINHCCEPSCTAKIIKVDGKKRIVIYALKDIRRNEELTYDYKFERETNDEERIACLCGAPGCKGFLN